MSVVQTSGGQIKPGRYSDFVSQAGEVSKIFQHLGAKPPRLHVAGLAGEAWGTWTFSVESDDLASFGALSDAFAADGEAQAFMLRLQEPDAPTVMQQVQVLLEIPVREPRGEHGPVLSVWVARPHPGGVEGTIAMAGRTNAFAEGRGAVDTHLFRTIGAGSGSGLFISTWEFENVTGYANTIEGFSTDPEGRAIAAAAGAADAPDALLFEAVYTEIPL